MTDPTTLAHVFAEQEAALAHEKEATHSSAAVLHEATKPRTQAERLIALAAEGQLFHTRDHVGYASVEVDGHWETHAIRGKGFRRWLVGRFYAAHDKPPNAHALNAALECLEAEACQRRAEEPVWVRTAIQDGVIYLDLGDCTWQAIEITATGWRPVASAPVRFRRAPGMLALPVPTAGGCLDLLRPFVNVATDEDFTLFVACLLATLRPQGPYPVLCLQGEQGSAKSTTARVYRELSDPATAPLRSIPREERDLMIAARNGWVLAFDNVSHLPPWLSDALCRLATGGGFSTRQLYTDDEEVIFGGQRPVILNGIEDLLERDDLRDRAVSLTLPPILDGARRDEERFWGRFREVQPAVLGTLCQAVSAALRDLPKTELETLPRMADFARWVTAGETALGWARGTFLAAYQENRQETATAFLESDAVALAVVELVDGRGPFEGTLKALLAALNGRRGEGKPPSRWPGNERALSGRLRRAAPALRRAGIIVAFMPKTNRGRVVRVSREPDATVSTGTTGTMPERSALSRDGRADGEATLSASVTAQGPSLVDADGGDGGDGRNPALRARRFHGQAICAKCGRPCERGPWREQLCNACALELGRREVEERSAS